MTPPLNYNQDADLGFLVGQAILGAEVEDTIDLDMTGKGEDLLAGAVEAENNSKGVIYTGLDDASFGYILNRGQLPVRVEMDTSGSAFSMLMHVDLDKLSKDPEWSRISIDTAAIYGAQLVKDFITGVHYEDPGEIFTHNLATTIKHVMQQNSELKGGNGREFQLQIVSDPRMLYMFAYNPEALQDANVYKGEKESEFQLSNIDDLFSRNYQVKVDKGFAFEMPVDQRAVRAVEGEADISAYMLEKMHPYLAAADILGECGFYQAAAIRLSEWIDKCDAVMDVFSLSFSDEVNKAMQELKQGVANLRKQYQGLALLNYFGAGEDQKEGLLQDLNDAVFNMPSLISMAYEITSVEQKDNVLDNNLAALSRYAMTKEPGQLMLPEPDGFEFYTD